MIDSMGLHTSVKAHINAGRPTLSAETDAVHEENEATNTNATVAAALSVLERTVSMASASSHGPSFCDGNIPCLPMLSSAAKSMASNGTRMTAETPPPSDGAILLSPHSPGLKRFELTDLRRATRSFHPDLLVAKGGLGCVFKGWVEDNPLTATAADPARTRTVIAVKRIEKESFESNMDWLKEVDNLRKLHHQNLVKLIGYCIEDDRQLLVYEFMPLGNLHNNLFGVNSHVQRLSWNLRMKIALGAATGLEFLHSCEGKEKYGNFKTSKILLDSNYDVKLCGYGMKHCRKVKLILPWYEDRVGEPDVDLYSADEYTAPEGIRTGAEPDVDLYSADEYTAPEGIRTGAEETARAAAVWWDRGGDRWLTEQESSYTSKDCSLFCSSSCTAECIIHPKDHFTTASDVYSFGIVLLEILSGRKAEYNLHGETGLVTVVTKLTSKQISSGAGDHIFDTSIRVQYPKRGARKALALVALCLQSEVEFRPNMNTVVTILKQLHSSS